MRPSLRAITAVAVLSCLLAAGARARAQTVYGPSGLFLHPTAFMPRRGAFSLNATTFSQGGDDPGEGSDWIPVTMTYAPTARTEVGVLYINRVYESEHRDSGGLYAKHQLLPDTPARPAFALTGSWIGGDIRQTTLAGVFSHRFTAAGRPLFTLHAGALWARSSYTETGPADGFGGFIGAEFPIGHGFRLVGEVGSRLAFNRRSAYAYGVMWTTRGGMNVGIGFVDVGYSPSPRFFVGVGYPIGGSR